MMHFYIMGKEFWILSCTQLTFI